MKRNIPFILFIFSIFFIQKNTALHAQSAKVFSIMSDNGLEKIGKTLEETSEEKISFLETLPQIFNTIQGKDHVVSTPQIDLLLSTFRQLNDEEDATGNFFFSAQFFTSAIKFDTSAIFNGVNFLLPKVSRYGFGGGISRTFKVFKNSTGMFGLDTFLLGKEIPKLDENNQAISSTTFASFHGSLNFEILFEDIVSLYGSVHTAKPLTNHNHYMAFFDLHKANFRTFMEVGLIVGFVLDNKEKENLLAVKIGFIPKNGYIKGFIDSAQSVNDGVPILEFNYTRLLKL